jgi:hypothetical protein
MRKVLLMAALAMAATLVFAPMAFAQTDLNCGDLSEAEEQSVFAADPSDPNNLDANDNGIPCEDDTTDNGSYVPPADDDDSSRPADEPDDVQYGPDDVQYGPDDVIDKTVPTTTVLPETGGVSAAGVVLPLALLVGGGLLAFRIVRRI